jgi:hypothetical protein
MLVQKAAGNGCLFCIIFQLYQSIEFEPESTGMFNYPSFNIINNYCKTKDGIAAIK